jgi:hypothetical protein
LWCGINTSQRVQEQETDTWRRKAERVDQEAAAFQRQAAEAAEQTETCHRRFAELEQRYGSLLTRLETEESERQTEVRHSRAFLFLNYESSTS